MTEIYTRREAIARVSKIATGLTIAATIGCDQEIDTKSPRPEFQPSPKPTVHPSIEPPSIQVANPPVVTFENKANPVEDKTAKPDETAILSESTPAPKPGIRAEPSENQASEDLSPKKLIPVEPTASPDVTPSPIPAPTETPKPLKLRLVPQKLTIISSGISYNQVEESIEIHDVAVPGQTTFYVPPQGVATPRYDLTNRLIVFGHSRIKGIPLPMGKLEDVNQESIILIDCVHPETQKQFINMVFVVSEINLGDKDSVAPMLFGEAPEIPTLYIQTSIRESELESDVAKPWILNEGKIRTKAHSIIEGDENDPKKYLLLLVVAHPTGETLDRLRDFQNSAN